MQKQVILVVDDHSDTRKMLRLALQGQFDIIEAENVVSALKLIKKKPTLIVLDVNMPGDHNGFDLLKMLRSNPRYDKVKIIMLTASSERKHFNFGYQYGVDRYFTKPFSPNLLATVIQELLAD